MVLWCSGLPVLEHGRAVETNKRDRSVESLPSAILWPLYLLWQ